jgi:hypothetical protein
MYIAAVALSLAYTYVKLMCCCEPVILLVMEIRVHKTIMLSVLVLSSVRDD